MHRTHRSNLVALVAATLSCVLGLGSAGLARAADKPAADTLEVIVPYGVGGGADSLARDTAPLLQRVLGKPVTVSNIPGRTGNAGMEKLLKSPSDGRLLSVVTAETYCLLAYANPGWKLTDIVPLAIMIKQPSAFFVSGDGRFKNWSELEKAARANPKALRVAISGLGSPDYLMLQQLVLKGIHFTPVPFDKPELRFAAIANGQADALYEQVADVVQQLQAKQLQPVLFVAAARVPAFRDVPVSGELGFGAGVPQFRAIVAKAGTDPSTLVTLAAALDKIVAMPEYKDFLKNQSAADDSYVASKNAPAFLQQQIAEMKRLVDTLPMHAQHLWEGQTIEGYIEPF